MKCDTCNTEFTAMPGMENTDQAVNCASTLYTLGGDFYILSHYGSEYDMQRHALKRGEYVVGNICDPCITNLIKDGKAWLIEDGVW